MRRALIIAVALMALRQEASAQMMVQVNIGRQPNAFVRMPYSSAQLYQQMQMVAQQRYGQRVVYQQPAMQQAVVYAPIQNQAPAQALDTGVARQDRMEERIQELKEQQQRMESQFNNLLLVLLGKQNPPSNVQSSNSEALRSELENLKSALRTLRDELSRISSTK